MPITKLTSRCIRPSSTIAAAFPALLTGFRVKQKVFTKPPSVTCAGRSWHTTPIAFIGTSIPAFCSFRSSAHIKPRKAVIAGKPWVKGLEMALAFCTRSRGITIKWDEGMQLILHLLWHGVAVELANWCLQVQLVLPNVCAQHHQHWSLFYPAGNYSASWRTD